MLEAKDCITTLHSLFRQQNRCLKPTTTIPMHTPALNILPTKRMLGTKNHHTCTPLHSLFRQQNRCWNQQPPYRCTPLHSLFRQQNRCLEPKSTVHVHPCTHYFANKTNAWNQKPTCVFMCVGCIKIPPYLYTLMLIMSQKIKCFKLRTTKALMPSTLECWELECWEEIFSV